MAARSDIEWTTHTWGVTRGCSRTGPECDNCYAMIMANRFPWGRHLTRRRTTHLPVVGTAERRLVDMIDWTSEIELHPEMLRLPLSWREPAKIFVNSTSDLFHPKIPDGYIAKTYGVMAVAARHVYQVLTKRPERIPAFYDWLGQRSDQSKNPHVVAALSGIDDLVSEDQIHETLATCSWPLPNVWVGTSVGIRDSKPRIDALREVPAAVRFLSLEPLLEDLGELDLRGIGWVIAGGESGQRSRPMHPDWVRSIRDQCAVADVPFFFKQHGAYGPADQFDHCDGKRYRFEDGQTVIRVGKKKAGRVLDGLVHDAMPA